MAGTQPGRNNATCNQFCGEKAARDVFSQWYRREKKKNKIVISTLLLVCHSTWSPHKNAIGSVTWLLHLAVFCPWHHYKKMNIVSFGPVGVNDLQAEDLLLFLTEQNGCVRTRGLNQTTSNQLIQVYSFKNNCECGWVFCSLSQFLTGLCKSRTNNRFS